MKKAVLNVTIIAAMMLLFWLSTSAQTAKGAPRCSGNQLSLKEVEGENDMGGKVYGNYVFTNISSKRCTLSGFPGFVLLNRSGRIMRGVKVTYDNSRVVSDEAAGGNARKTPKVTLKPKQTAWFQIFYNNGMPFNLKKPPASSASIKVTAPHTTKAFFIKSSIGAYKEVQVSAVRSGLPQ